MSPCFSVPRFGTVPRGEEKERVSEVRFSSRMLSLITGTGSGVGVTALSGRKMVLKPLPAQSPTRAASGPRGAGGGGGETVLRSERTNENLKPAVISVDTLGFESLIL